MDGPQILAATMSVPLVTDTHGQLWQYHPRSDLHSKVACWGVLFDLINQSSVLQKHITAGKVVLGVHMKLTDYSNNRTKVLDLVIARPTGGAPKTARSMADLASQWGIVLTKAQEANLASMPALEEGPVGAVLMALEAKATMTAHTKSRPRLFDELSSSHVTIHGHAAQALAVGLEVVNISPAYISPTRNDPGLPLVITQHKQPHDTIGIISKMRELPRRTTSSAIGFDGFGLLVIDLVNDGTPATIVTSTPAPPPGDVLHYDTMVTRVAHEYDTNFKHI